MQNTTQQIIKEAKERGFIPEKKEDGYIPGLPFCITCRMNEREREYIGFNQAISEINLEKIIELAYDKVEKATEVKIFKSIENIRQNFKENQKTATNSLDHNEYLVAQLAITKVEENIKIDLLK